MLTKDQITNKLFCGDCIEVMKQFPDECIDLILTDPPYGTTACKWDIIVPFNLMWKELLRISKNNTPIIFTASQPFTSALIMSNPKIFRHEWIYKKLCASNFAQAKYAPMKEHESVLVFGKNKPNYYPIKEERKGSGKERVKHIFTKKSSNNKGEFVGNFKSNNNFKMKPEELRYPSSVQEFNNRAKGDRGKHPTQKPIALMEYFINTYSRENSLVLDCFAGSGTTLVACKKLNRNWCGIEISPEYCKIIQERLKNTEVK